MMNLSLPPRCGIPESFRRRCDGTRVVVRAFSGGPTALDVPCRDTPCRDGSMLQNLTYGKVKQVIGLAREAARNPAPDVTVSSRYPVSHDPPLRPQPDATSWESAFCRYLADMPEAAIAELEALYRLGAGEFDRLDLAIVETCGRDTPKDERIAFLDSRRDLASALEDALQAW